MGDQWGKSVTGHRMFFMAMRVFYLEDVFYGAYGCSNRNTQTGDATMNRIKITESVDARNSRLADQARAERAIAADLTACDLGLALTKGKTRRTYAKHRKDCFEAIRDMNKADGLDQMSDDDLLDELFN